MSDAGRLARGSRGGKAVSTKTKVETTETIRVNINVLVRALDVLEPEHVKCDNCECALWFLPDTPRVGMTLAVCGGCKWQANVEIVR
jgi:hypothetical protein